MRDQEGCEIAKHDAGDDADRKLLDQVDQRGSKRELAAPRRDRQYTEGDDRADRVIEGGLAHHGLRDAVADVDLAEDRHQRRRIGRGQRRTEQERHDHGDAENVMGRDAGDGGRDQHADCGDHHDGDPDLLQDIEPQRRAAIEQDVARAEQQDDLVQRRICPDMDEAERLRADRDARDQEYRDVGDPDFLCEHACQRANRENQPARQQRVFGDLDGGGHFQLVSLNQEPRCRMDQFSAFSQLAMSLAATFACCSNLPMVKKPWNWPGKCL